MSGWPKPYCLSPCFAASIHHALPRISSIHRISNSFPRPLEVSPYGPDTSTTWPGSEISLWLYIYLTPLAVHPWPLSTNRPSVGSPFSLPPMRSLCMNTPDLVIQSCSSRVLFLFAKITICCYCWCFSRGCANCSAARRIFLKMQAEVRASKL